MKITRNQENLLKIYRGGADDMAKTEGFCGFK